MTTKKLDEFFNQIPKKEEIKKEIDKVIDEPEKVDNSDMDNEEEMVVNKAEISHELTEITNLENQIAAIKNVEDHEKDMDLLHDMAMKGYNHIMEEGDASESRDASQFYQAAVRMMKNALDAKQSKAFVKLKLMDLEIKLKRIKQQNDDEDTDGIILSEDGKIFVAKRGDILNLAEEKAQKDDHEQD